MVSWTVPRQGIPAALDTGCYVGLSPDAVGSTAPPPTANPGDHHRACWTGGRLDGPNTNLCGRCTMSTASVSPPVAMVV